MIDKVVSLGDITSYRYGSTSPFISHLFFTNDSLLFAKANNRNCKTVRRILVDYEIASGQVVNFNKSAICTSKSVSRVIGDRLANIVGVKLVKCRERYLGLPSFARRNKRQLFDGLKDRIWSKVLGWNNKLFSAGGKEVLLKAMVQSIPSYTMNLFRLLEGFISDVHHLCSRFWWGSSDSERKLQWGLWAKLCSGKSACGLGFRDLSLFNQAMLTKQCWRLIKWPNSLVARVVKGRYFPTTDFLHVVTGGSDSFV